jgi:hypothetical protein
MKKTLRILGNFFSYDVLPKRDVVHGAGLLIAAGLLFLGIQVASAQTELRGCRGLGAGSGVDEQVLCWQDKEESKANECMVDQQGRNACTMQVISWCANASFNQSFVVNTCFLAYLRAGQFEKALSLDKHIKAPTAQVTKCRQALSSVSLKVVSSPQGADILVDGNSKGKTPVQVQLTGNWLQSKVVARFQVGDRAVDKAVTGEELTAVFDRKRCEMGELAVKAPGRVESSPPSAAASLAPQTSDSERVYKAEYEPVVQEPVAEKEPARKSSGVSVPGVILTVAGGAVLITGGILLAISESRASELSSPDDGLLWTKSRQRDFNSVKPLRIVGGVALGAGAAAAVLGVIFLVRGSSREGETERANLQITGQGLQWVGRF